MRHSFYMLVFRITRCLRFLLLFCCHRSNCMCRSKIADSLHVVRCVRCCLKFDFFSRILFCWWFLFWVSFPFRMLIVSCPFRMLPCWLLFEWSGSLSDVIWINCVAPLMPKVIQKSSSSFGMWISSSSFQKSFTLMTTLLELRKFTIKFASWIYFLL